MSDDNDSYVTWARKGVSLFFEYDTPRIVHIKSKKVGVISRSENWLKRVIRSIYQWSVFQVGPVADPDLHHRLGDCLPKGISAV